MNNLKSAQQVFKVGKCNKKEKHTLCKENQGFTQHKSIQNTENKGKTNAEKEVRLS